MTNAPEPHAPVPPAASPYGPADGSAGGTADGSADGAVDGVQQLFGEVTAPDGPSADAPAADGPPADAPAADDDVTLAPTGDSDTVTRARRTLKRLAITLPLVGLALSTAAIAVQIVTGGAFGVDPVNEIAGFTVTFLGPTLIVLGLHMVVWRAMVRPLSRMTPGSRAGMIIGIGGVLSFVSVILVFVLVFVGFILISLLFTLTDQVM